MTTAIDLGTVDLDATRAQAGVDALSRSLGSLDSQVARTAAKTSDLRSRLSQFQQNIRQGIANNFVQQMVPHTQELTRNLGSLEQSAANAGIALLGNLGLVGQVGQAAIGVYGAIVGAEREQQEALRITNEMLNERLRLQHLARNIEATAPRGATDAQRLQLLQAEGARIRAATMAEENRIRGAVSGMNADQAHAATMRLRDAINSALPGIRSYGDEVNRNTQLVDVLSAVTTQNVAQLRSWGLSIQFGTNAATNNAAALVALAEARQRTTAATVRGARAEVEAARRADRLATGMRRFFTEDTPQMIAARGRLTQATAALAAAERDAAAATGAATRASQEHAVAIEAEIAANNRLKEEEQERQKHAATARAQANAHTAQEIRDLRHQIGLALERTRSVNMHTRYIGLSISATRELLELEQRRAHFEAQRHHTFAQRQRYLTDLQREIELRSQIVEGERAIRQAMAETARARAAAQQASLDATVNALIEQERVKEQQQMESAGAQKALESAALARADAERQAIINGFVEPMKRAGESLTTALGSSFASVITGTKGVKAAVTEALQSTLEAVAAESFGKALFQGASAIAAAASGNAPAAILHAKAAAGFAATAAVAGGLAAGGKAMTASASGSAATPGGSAPSPSAGLPSGPRGGSDALPPITINYNAPVIGGRDAMAWETGARIGRYLGQADSRVRRVPALMGA